MSDLLINLLASIIAGTAVWATQRGLRLRRLAVKRAFFGLENGAGCLLAVARHASSPNELSVHRRDVAAIVELTTIAKDCGSRADLTDIGDMPRQIGRLTEFCVGGPTHNPRSAAHLRTILRGVSVASHEVEAPKPRVLAFTVGDTTYTRDRQRADYVVLARVWGPVGGRPVFLISGLTAQSNLAAARYLSAEFRALHRRYGSRERFCLVLRIVEPDAYGTDFIELVADVTGEAFDPPGERSAAIAPDASAPAA